MEIYLPIQRMKKFYNRENMKTLCRMEKNENEYFCR